MQVTSSCLMAYLVLLPFSVFMYMVRPIAPPLALPVSRAFSSSRAISSRGTVRPVLCWRSSAAVSMSCKSLLTSAHHKGVTVKVSGKL